MIKRKNYLGVLLAVLLVSCQCEKDEILEQSVMKTSLVSIQENDLNKSRLQLAFMLSQALSGDYKMQNRLIDECSKAFDGDINVLCAALFEPQKQKESGSFYSLLQQKVNNNVINNLLIDLSDIDMFFNSLIQKDPLIHIYYYESNMEMGRQNVKFMVLSGFGDDEKEPLYIIDSKGNISQHDPYFEPEESMFVIATNERTHIQIGKETENIYLTTRGLNYVLENATICTSIQQNEDNKTGKGNIATTRGSNYSNKDWLHSIKFSSYKRLREVEPASKGQPEVDIYYTYLETNSIINTVDKDGNIITEYTEGKGARTFRDPIRGTFCQKKGDKVFRVVVNNQLPMWIETSMLGDKFLYYVLEKDSGKSAVWNTPSIPVKTEGIKGKAASDWISAGVKIIKLIGKLLYRENHDDYITELYDYVAKDNVIRDNSLINDSNFNRSFGGLQWWITSQQD